MMAKTTPSNFHLRESKKKKYKKGHKKKETGREPERRIQYFSQEMQRKGGKGHVNARGTTTGHHSEVLVLLAYG
jgi:hypothetical protein